MSPDETLFHSAMSFSLTNDPVCPSSVYDFSPSVEEKEGWTVSPPMPDSLHAFLSISRLGLLMANAPLMIIEKSFSGFAVRFKPLVTTALIFSAITDLVVSAARYLLLPAGPQRGLSHVLDGIVIFTINDGCAVAIAAAACWVAMPNNFVWLSIYFTIAKCKPIFLELE
ncbi:hypothetical protein FB45DRAFT_1071876 [Roridomyces roridus]|uniref:DUF6534 domain-containing protein n=1 Tax=Roridomyces roridus TaxID=1738132 RepID=A0AAD7AXP4_9AGAR|nr:hypothetical protein FB45DRAFT_1071876 [Roridomyces roridus]